MGLKNWLLGRRGGFDGLLSAHYADILRWQEIYDGGGEWRYTRKGGLQGGTRKVASLGAAKAVCAELSKLCFAEGAAVTSADRDTAEFLTRVLSENRFDERFPAFLQSVFALGGGMVKIYWENGVKLDFVTADCFVPTSWNSREITGAAFGSEISDNGRRFFLAETQQAEGGRLTIENRLYNDAGTEVKLSELYPELREKSVIEGLERPLFVYFGTGIAGAQGCGLLGKSVLSGAEDTLKQLDLVFDSLGREFVLGKKRIIVPYYAIRGEYDEHGNIKKYFDVNDEVFQAMSVSDTEELKFSDNTAQLRVTEHTDAISALLDLLCMQVGLSEGALSYKNGSIRTATEVVSRNSRTYRTGAHYRGIIAAALTAVLENIAVLGKLGGVLPDYASQKAAVALSDGAAEDDSARCDRALKLYNAGVISRARAISQVYGLPLSEAKAMESEDFDDDRGN